MAGGHRLREPKKLPELIFFRSGEDRRERVVAFIHGLGGGCYKTWGRQGEPATFLERLAEDLPGVDIATYGYPTGLVKRTGVQATVDDWRNKLTNSLLADYPSVAIVCHSLGGVITMMALGELFFRRPTWHKRLREGESRLTLFLIGVPTHGTKTRGGGALSKELEIIDHDSAVIEKNLAFWQSRVQQPRRALEESDIPILTWTVVGTKDVWVTPSSARSGVEEDYVHRVPLGHTDLVKPPTKEDEEKGKHQEHEPYEFVLEQLREEIADPDWLRPPLPRPRAAAPVGARYADRSLILAANRAARELNATAREARAKRDYLAASRAYLSAVEVAVETLATEHDNIISLAETCRDDRFENVRELKQSLNDYLHVSLLRKQIDAAQSGLERCREDLEKIDPPRAESLDDAKEAVARLVAELELRRETPDRQLQYRPDAGTGVGWEGLKLLLDCLRSEPLNPEIFAERLELARRDPGKRRIDEALNRLKEIEL